MALLYLSITLLLLLAICWRISSLNPIAPSVVSVSVFLASTLLLALGPQTLHKDISEATILVILVGLVSFLIGDIFARLCLRENRTPNTSINLKPVKISRTTYIGLLIFSALTLIWSYVAIKEMAEAVGYREGEHLLIQYARLAVLQNELRPSFVLIIFSFMLRAISYVLTFVYLYNRVLAKDRGWPNKLLLIPSAIYLIQYMLWGSRGAVIEYISFFIFLYAHFKSRIAKTPSKFNLEVLSVSINGLGLFIIIFAIAGTLKGWSEFNPLDVVSIYGGGSISALDVYLNSANSVHTHFGEETLLGIYALLERVGISSVPSSRILDFMTIGQSETTNIYTSLRRYIADYGITGMIYVQFFLGFIFSLGFMKLENSRKIGYFSLFYSIYFMALVYQPLDEQALTTLLSTTQIFTIGFTFVFFQALTKRKLNRPKSATPSSAT